jgi:hypothetical protein
MEPQRLSADLAEAAAVSPNTDVPVLIDQLRLRSRKDKK